VKKSRRVLSVHWSFWQRRCLACEIFCLFLLSSLLVEICEKSQKTHIIHTFFRREKMKRVIAVITLTFVFLTGQALAAEWTTPVPVASGVNTQYADETPFLSSDGLSLYFSRGYDSGYYFRIYEAKRSQPSGDFTSVNQVLSSSGCHVMHPWVSPDNLRMYYHVESSSWQVKMSQRTSVNDPWSAGTVVSGLPSPIVYETLSQDELTMVFDAPNGSNGRDLYITSRTDRNSSFGNIRYLSEINSSASDDSPSLSPDGLSLYFSSDRNGLSQIFETTRQSINNPFGNPMLLPIDMPNGVAWPDISISGNGKALYFGCGGTNPDIYVSYNVPEPATLALLGLGALALRKRRKLA